MEEKKRKKAATLTPENIEESRRLKAIWDEVKPENQAGFGATYDIGGQGMVWQCLNGKQAAISLKAAAGFAKGLGCAIEDFSPRLSALALDYASKATKEPIWPFKSISREAFYKMDPHWRGMAEKAARDVLDEWEREANNAGHSGRKPPESINSH